MQIPFYVKFWHRSGKCNLFVVSYPSCRKYSSQTKLLTVKGIIFSLVIFPQAPNFSGCDVFSNLLKNSQLRCTIGANDTGGKWNPKLRRVAVVISDYPSPLCGRGSGHISLGHFVQYKSCPKDSSSRKPSGTLGQGHVVMASILQLCLDEFP
jgi:hypothetical protein